MVADGHFLCCAKLTFFMNSYLKALLFLQTQLKGTNERKHIRNILALFVCNTGTKSMISLCRWFPSFLPQVNTSDAETDHKQTLIVRECIINQKFHFSLHLYFVYVR